MAPKRIGTGAGRAFRTSSSAHGADLTSWASPQVTIRSAISGLSVAPAPGGDLAPGVADRCSGSLRACAKARAPNSVELPASRLLRTLAALVRAARTLLEYPPGSL